MAGPWDGPGVAPRASAGRKPERAGRGPRGGRGASWDPKFASLSVTSRDRSARCPRATREAPVPRPARAPVARGARTCSRSLRGEWPRPDEAAQARAAPAAAGRPAGGRAREDGARSGESAWGVRGERARGVRGEEAPGQVPRVPHPCGLKGGGGGPASAQRVPRFPAAQTRGGGWGWWGGGGAGTPRAPPFMGGVAAFWGAVGRLSQFKWTLVCAEPTLNRVSLQNTSQRETFQSQVVTQIGFAGERGLSQASVERGEGSPARGRSPPCQGQGLAG